MIVDLILEPGTDAATATRVAVLAERYGIRGLWASNFPAQRDPFMTLMPAALATERIRLGVMPYSPYEKHPVKIADSLLTLHDASRGRAMILLGGMGKSVMMATGLKPEHRVTAVREGLEIVRGCGSGERFSFRGKHYEANNYHAPWSPQPPPLLYLGANGPQMLQLAGSIADGVILSDLTETLIGPTLQHVDAGMARAQRQRAGWRVSNFFAWHIKPDLHASMAEARMELVWRGALLRSHIAPYLAEEEILIVERNWNRFLDAFLRRSSTIEGVPDAIVEKLIAGLTFAGDESAIAPAAARLLRLQQLGQTEVALRLFREPEQAVRLIGEQLLPALAAAVA